MEEPYSLSEEDLKHVGRTTCGNDGMTIFTIDTDDEYEYLFAFLRDFGYNAKIILTANNEHVFLTNYPWDRYILLY